MKPPMNENNSGNINKHYSKSCVIVNSQIHDTGGGGGCFDETSRSFLRSCGLRSDVNISIVTQTITLSDSQNN